MHLEPLVLLTCLATCNKECLSEGCVVHRGSTSSPAGRSGQCTCTASHCGARWCAHAGQCAIISCGLQRTMRTCISPDCRLLPSDLCPELFASGGVPPLNRWVFTSAYTLNTEGLLPSIIINAREVGRTSLAWIFLDDLYV